MRRIQGLGYTTAGGMHMKKRTMVISFVLTWAILLSAGRVTHLSLGTTYRSVASQQSLFTLSVQPIRGKIYDRNGLPFTQQESVQKVAFAATPQVISYVHRACLGQEKQTLLSLLSGRRPFLWQTKTAFAVKGATVFQCSNLHPSWQSAVHSVGYTDGSGTIGLSGMEKAFQQLLYTGTSQTITYACDAAGGSLAGVLPQIDTPKFSLDFGVYTTLNRALQQTVEEVFPKSFNGAVVVQKAGSGELLALHSAPAFSPADLSAALQDGRFPMLNRYLTPYNVGSIFKLCVAAAALEQGISPDFVYTCTGSIHCSLDFACHKTEGHGELTMGEAMAQSCNTYFIHLADQIGGQAVYDMALSMGLGQSIYLCDDVIGQKGQLPDLSELLRSPAELANFAIGQGVFLATPLQISALVNAIANGGVYFTPRLVAKTVDGKGAQRIMHVMPGKRIISPKTADLLSDMMQAVTANGTGKLAQPVIAAAGKTATAQTGMQTEDGQPITQAWFTGFFPAAEPQYCVTVLVEDGKSGGSDAAPIFKAICEKMELS